MLSKFWKNRLTDFKILHYTRKKGWQCPEAYKQMEYDNQPKSETKCKKDPSCAFVEGYQWYNHLKKAEQIVDEKKKEDLENEIQ